MEEESSSQPERQAALSDCKEGKAKLCRVKSVTVASPGCATMYKCET